MTDIAIAKNVSHDDYESVVLSAVNYNRRVYMRLDGRMGRFRFSFVSPPTTGFYLNADTGPIDFILPAGQAIYLHAEQTWGDTCVVSILATLASPDQVIP